MDPTPTHPERAPDPAPGSGATSRPDWLIGADEGVEAELQRAAQMPKTELRLVKPLPETLPPPPPPAELGDADFGALDLTSSGAPAPPAPPGGWNVLTPGRGRKEAKPAEPPPPEKKAWAAAASSVPKLHLVRESPPPAAVAAPSGRPEEGQEGSDAHAFPDDIQPSAPAPVARVREAWWLVALDGVRTNRRVHVLLGCLGAVLLAAVLLWPREDVVTSLKSIHKHPDQWDGRIVSVRGRVGEVFRVGGGYAFYLHDGRDTIVVFTRSRQPVPRRTITVKGSISTGFLDGVPRQSLFEDV